MKKSTFVFILFCLLSLSCFAQKKITLKIASVAPARSAWETEQKALAAEWSRITNGQVVLQFYNTIALGGEDGVVQKMRPLRPGQPAPLDGAIFTNIGAYELAPESNILTLAMPFLFKNQEEVDLVLEALSSEISDAMKVQGFELLGWFNVGWANFYTKKEIRTPEELKKIKLSVGGVTSSELGKAFQRAGYMTEDVPNDKILQSIKSANGVQGLYTIPMYAYASQYHKSLNYVLNTAICPVLANFVVSEASWNKIPNQYKDDLLAAVKQSEEKFIGFQQKTDKEYLSLMEKEGLHIVNLTEKEIAVFQETLKTDALLMSESKTETIIDYKMYQKISAILKKHREK